MAIFTGNEGLFEVTAVSYTPAVITFGETINVSVTIKNVSGKSVTKMYVTASGRYARPDSTSMGTCSTNDVYLHGSAYYNMATVSWANGASKTFTFSYAFTKGFYDADLSSYLLTKKIAISIVTGTTFSTGGNYENFADISEGYLTVLSARDNPRLSMTLDRCTAGRVNDEGESLLTDLKLVSDVSAATFNSHGYTASISVTPEPPGGCALTASIADMLTGITDSATAISGTFNNGTDYSITVTVSNGYETAVAKQDISRAFANVHMSGQPTGGICFGGFSSAERNKPKFECYFPATFYGGIDHIGETVQLTMETGFVTPGDYGMPLTLLRLGNIVFIIGSIKRTTSGKTIVCKLPEGWGPKTQSGYLFCVGTGNNIARLCVHQRSETDTTYPNGYIGLEWYHACNTTTNSTATFSWVSVTGMWLIE